MNCSVYTQMRQVPKIAQQRPARGSFILLSLIPMFIVVSISTGKSIDVEPDLPGNLALYLPHVVFAVPDMATNIYFDNTCLVVNPANYVFSVNCSKGIQQAERWTFSPTSGDVGSYPLSIEVLDEMNKVIARASTTISVIPKDSGAGRAITVLLIGDSLTHLSVYSQHLLDLSKGDTAPKITLIGSHVPDSNHPTNRHEGYGGWTARDFASRYNGIAKEADYTKRGSPFLYKDANEKPQLDFGRYCDEFNSGKGPDFVTILLGANDIGSASESNINNTIDEMLTHYDKLVKMIHDCKPATKIGILLTVPPAASQDAFGANYGCTLKRWQFKRNQHHLVKRLIDHYSNRESDNIYVVGTNVGIDCVRGYPPSNALHPSESGYCQIGDVIYSWIKACLSSKS